MNSGGGNNTTLLYNFTVDTQIQRLPVWQATLFGILELLETCLAILILCWCISYIKQKQEKESSDVVIVNSIVAAMVAGSIFCLDYIIAMIFAPVSYIPAVFLSALSLFSLTFFHAVNLITLLSFIFIKKYKAIEELIKEDRKISVEIAVLITLVAIVSDNVGPLKSNSFIFDLLTQHSGIESPIGYGYGTTTLVSLVIAMGIMHQVLLEVDGGSQVGGFDIKNSCIFAFGWGLVCYFVINKLTTLEAPHYVPHLILICAILIIFILLPLRIVYLNDDMRFYFKRKLSSCNPFAKQSAYPVNE